MRRLSGKLFGILSSVGTMAVAGYALAEDVRIAPQSSVRQLGTIDTRSPKPDIIPVQAQDQPPSLTTPTATGTAATGRFGTSSTQAPPALSDAGSGSAGTGAQRSDAANNDTGSGGTAINNAGGAGAGVANAPTIGEFLGKSAASAGVDIQQRNGVSAEPRVRGYRVGQLVTLGDGGLFFPVRQDLDTAVTKFDPASVRDVVIFRGPYTSIYGQGFAFLDIATLDAPRYECGFEWHGRTAARYQTNGNRWDAVQSFSMGDRDWGARLTYNFLQGNDYEAGDGTQVPSSYLSHNVNLALGFDLNKNSSLELKFLRVHQQDVEFPGYYFDIRELNTEAYSARYVLRDQPQFDKFTFDLWYNTTGAKGDTLNGIKQAFVRNLLSETFNNDFRQGEPGSGVNGPNQPSFYNDQSTSTFSNKSMGYRGAFWWGGTGKNVPTLILGHDLTYLGSNLTENILFTQSAGIDPNTGQPLPIDPNTGLPIPITFTQRQSIPDARLINPGLFAEMSLPINEAVNIRTGGRLDFVQANAGNRLITGNINIFGPPPVIDPVDPFLTDPFDYSVRPQDKNNHQHFTLFSAFLTGDWKLDDHMTFSAGYARGMRSPTLTELYGSGPFLGVLQQGTSRLIGDPHLDPETVNQFDVGLQTRYDWYRGGVTAFYAFIEDYITYDQVKGDPTAAVLNQLVFTNTNLATLAGFETFSEVELTGWLTMFGGTSYVQGTDRSHRDNRRPENVASSRRNDPALGEFAVATEPLPQIPPFEGRLGLRVHEFLLDNTQAPKWSVEFALRSVAEQRNVAESLSERPNTSFVVYDLRSYWQVNERLLLTGGVENLFNKTYREYLDPISGNLVGGPDGVGPFYRPGRNFYMGAQVTY